MSETTAQLRVALNKVLLQQLESAGVRESTLIQVRNDIEGRSDKAPFYDQSSLSASQVSGSPPVNTEMLRMQVMELDATLARMHQSVLRLRTGLTGVTGVTGGPLGDVEILSAEAREKVSRVRSELESLAAPSAPQVVKEEIVVKNGVNTAFVRLPRRSASPEKRAEEIAIAKDSGIHEVAIEAAVDQVTQAEVNAMEAARRAGRSVGPPHDGVQIINGQMIPMVNMPAISMPFAAGAQVIPQRSGAGSYAPPMPAPAAPAPGRPVSPVPTRPGMPGQGMPAQPMLQLGAQPPATPMSPTLLSQRAPSTQRGQSTIGLPTPGRPVSPPPQASQPPPAFALSTQRSVTPPMVPLESINLSDFSFNASGPGSGPMVATPFFQDQL